MFGLLTLGLGLILISGCQAQKLTAEASAEVSSNLLLNYANQSVSNYKFNGVDGTYDVIITTRNLPSDTINNLSSVIYTNVDAAKIQNTLVFSNTLSLKPFHGIFVQGSSSQQPSVAVNSVLIVNGNLCSVMASNVALVAESIVAVEFDQTGLSDQVLSVKAVPHQANKNPCGSPDAGTPTNLGQTSGSGSTTTTVSFSRDIFPGIIGVCTNCHSSFTTYQGVRATVFARDVAKSGLYTALTGKMSQYAPAGLADKVKIWINEGALNN